jgi:hypothetical protein
MRRFLQIIQGGLFVCFNFFLLLTIYQVAGGGGSSLSNGFGTPVYDNKEDYDPSLNRLSTISKLTVYCDSVYEEVVYTNPALKFESAYPEIVSKVVRKRFYHGYSTYGTGNNIVGGLFASVTKKGLTAIVIADDILKYPYAACSQQSIVMMDVLEQKGFKTRKVGFEGPRGGHFCFETYFDGKWHFYDPDMEPDVRLLLAYQRPSVAFIASHTSFMLQAYRQYPAEKMMNLFSNYFYGKVNAPAAPWAYWYQQITKFLSYTLWSFFLVLFILVRRRLLRTSAKTNVRHSRIHIPQLQPGTPVAVNLEY